MKEIEVLLKTGLLVDPTGSVGPYKNGYAICNPRSNLLDSPDNNKYEYCYFSTSDGKRVEMGDAGSHLYLKDGLWVFEVWECVPGPAESDFVCQFTELQTAVDIVINFYFGKPTVIQDWIFPLHRHPELNIELIDSAIKNAIEVSQSEFDILSSQLWEQVEENGPFYAWEKALIGGFLKVFHMYDKSKVLMVRRDLYQSFLICN